MLYSSASARIALTRRVSAISSSSYLHFFSNTSLSCFSEKPLHLSYLQVAPSPSPKFPTTGFPPPPIFLSPSYRFYPVRSVSEMASQSSKTSIHDFTVKDARGNDVDLSTYKGKVLLIVNVASQCGLTNSNYTELSQLYEKYKNEALVLV